MKYLNAIILMWKNILKILNSNPFYFFISKIKSNKTKAFNKIFIYADSLMISVLRYYLFTAAELEQKHGRLGQSSL